MELVLTEVLDYLNNYFWEKKISGTFSIVDGSLEIIGMKEGQYYRIIGSTFNDGVHKYPATEQTLLKDETFTGAIWALAVPQTVIAIASDVSEWQEQYGGADSAALSPFNSESFGNYSYSKGNVSAGSTGSVPTWQDVFGGRLNKYRKLRGSR